MGFHQVAFGPSPENLKKIYHLKKKLWSIVYQNMHIIENILSVADISLGYQSGNYQLQLTEIWLLCK